MGRGHWGEGGAWSAELVDEAVGVGDAVNEGEEVRQDPLQPLVPHRRVRGGAPRGVGGFSTLAGVGACKLFKAGVKNESCDAKTININHNVKL